MQSASVLRKLHSHMWLFASAGLAIGVALITYVRSLKAVSLTSLWFPGFHLLGGIVLFGALYVSVGRRSRPSSSALDFGWSLGWTLGPLLAALAILAAALVIQIETPGWWPAAIVLTLLAANAFAGHLIAAAVGRVDHAPLPLVELLPGGRGRVLDGGCGAGRTSVAVARGLSGAEIVALDRFDAGYIEGGGRTLLDRNLRLSGLEGRVRVEEGDLTALPFERASFDAAVSAHAIDHLGKAKEAGLREMWRVLKPGGRFLLIVWAPSWTMFAVANLLAFSLAGRDAWREMALGAGFEIIDDGIFSGHSFLLLRKPVQTENTHV